MGRLIYSAIASLDGYVADDDGRFDWCAPDEEVHAAVNDSVRSVGTQLYGRRMYEVLQVWETMDVGSAPSPSADFQALWRAADKIVYSSTLDAPATARTRIERTFDPVAVGELVRGLDHDVSVGGPQLAGAALRAGLVDVLELFLSPVVIGGGTAALPSDSRIPLSSTGCRRFAGGVVQLTYGVARSLGPAGA
ncbi:dihydrofolate reductase family protein [Nakamurella deserti]|uniref:dihydrofolate reductase family protein n=1 Tax=Nakamurella deserti TaxID=2164074 RepID=UPI000DBE904E|nr:dihydrofolate reductase family protein [Nakamurella deserti]